MRQTERDRRDIPDLDCTEFVLMVDDLVSTDPKHWGPVVDKHLTDCPPCLIYLQQMLDIQTALRHVQRGQTLSDDEVTRILTAVSSR